MAADGLSKYPEVHLSYSKDYRSPLTPDERRLELAAILGQGLLRFFGSSAMEAESHRHIAPGEELETVQKALDVSPINDPVVSRLTQQRS